MTEIRPIGKPLRETTAYQPVSMPEAIAREEGPTVEDVIYNYIATHPGVYTYGLGIWPKEILASYGVPTTEYNIARAAAIFQAKNIRMYETAPLNVLPYYAGEGEWKYPEGSPLAPPPERVPLGPMAAAITSQISYDPKEGIYVSPSGQKYFVPKGMTQAGIMEWLGGVKEPITYGVVYGTPEKTPQVIKPEHFYTYGPVLPQETYYPSSTYQEPRWTFQTAPSIAYTTKVEGKKEKIPSIFPLIEFFTPKTLEEEHRRLKSMGISPSSLTNIGFASREMMRGIIAAPVYAIPSAYFFAAEVFKTPFEMYKTGDVLLPFKKIGGAVIEFAYTTLPTYPAFIGGSIIGSTLSWRGMSFLFKKISEIPETKVEYKYEYQTYTGEQFGLSGEYPKGGKMTSETIYGPPMAEEPKIKVPDVAVYAEIKGYKNLELFSGEIVKKPFTKMIKFRIAEQEGLFKPLYNQYISEIELWKHPTDVGTHWFLGLSPEKEKLLGAKSIATPFTFEKIGQGSIINIENWEKMFQTIPEEVPITEVFPKGFGYQTGYKTYALDVIKEFFKGKKGIMGEDIIITSWKEARFFLEPETRMPFTVYQAGKPTTAPITYPTPTSGVESVSFIESLGMTDLTKVGGISHIEIPSGKIVSGATVAGEAMTPRMQLAPQILGEPTKIPYTITTYPYASLGKIPSIFIPPTLSFPTIKQPTTQPSIKPEIEPKLKPIIMPKIEPSVQPISRPIIMPEIKPMIQPKIETRLEPQIKPIVEPKITPQLQLKIEPQIQPKLEPKIEPKIQPKIEIEITPRIIPKTYPSSYTQPSRKIKPSMMRIRIRSPKRQVYGVVPRAGLLSQAHEMTKGIARGRWRLPKHPKATRAEQKRFAGELFTKMGGMEYPTAGMIAKGRRLKAETGMPSVKHIMPELKKRRRK